MRKQVSNEQPESTQTEAELGRLRWKCRRGMRELDLLLRDFMDAEGTMLDAAERRLLDRLLDYPDAILLEYLLGRTTPLEGDLKDVVHRIRNAAGP